MIELKKLSKVFESASGSVEALRDVDLTINDGEIFGIIGLSGAGKSTLVRCINLLERPSSGQVIIDGRDMTALSRPELLKMRRRRSNTRLRKQNRRTQAPKFPKESRAPPKSKMPPVGVTTLR